MGVAQGTLGGAGERSRTLCGGLVVRYAAWGRALFYSEALKAQFRALLGCLRVKGALEAQLWARIGA